MVLKVSIICSNNFLQWLFSHKCYPILSYELLSRTLTNLKIIPIYSAPFCPSNATKKLPSIKILCLTKTSLYYSTALHITENTHLLQSSWEVEINLANILLRLYFDCIKALFTHAQPDINLSPDLEILWPSNEQISVSKLPSAAMILGLLS